MRGDAAADAEIRKVALAMLRILQEESPNLFGDYEILEAARRGAGGHDPHPKSLTRHGHSTR